MPEACATRGRYPHEERVHAAALAKREVVLAGCSNHLVADCFDAWVEERGEGGLVPREVMKGLVRAAVGAEGEDDAVLATLAPASSARSNWRWGSRRAARGWCRGGVLMSVTVIGRIEPWLGRAEHRSWKKSANS